MFWVIKNHDNASTKTKAIAIIVFVKFDIVFIVNLPPDVLKILSFYNFIQYFFLT